MRISIASGKGGTGKTTIATNLALALGAVQYIDADVEEPNGHLFLKPRVEERISVGIPVPKVDMSQCTHCGMCADICEYHAIVVIKDKLLTFPELCHGCGGCSYLCPADAIAEAERDIGVIEKGMAGPIEFVHAHLNVGEPMAPPLIRKIKTLIHNAKPAIIDAPPGTSCPVVESVKGTDFCALVTEPTPFGLNDLMLAVEMVRILEIPFGVIVNMADIGNRDVWDYCQKEAIPILMEIPFDRKIAELYSKGTPLTQALPEYKKGFLKLYHDITSKVAS